MKENAFEKLSPRCIELEDQATRGIGEGLGATFADAQWGMFIDATTILESSPVESNENKTISSGSPIVPEISRQFISTQELIFELVE